jgi:CRISPR-associated protein Csx14
LKKLTNDGCREEIMNQLLQESVMVATVGGQPQVVTFALDGLIEQGERVREVVVLHLSPDNPRFAHALKRLWEEFEVTQHYGRDVRLRLLPVRDGRERLVDIRNEAEADAAWNAIHELIVELKAQGRPLHFAIAGGRRLLALLAVSAALLHFGHQDRMWHLYTPDDFLERAREGAIMHARPEDGVRLIQVPLVPWGSYFPALRSLTRAPSAQVLAAQTRWLDSTERTRCQKVVGRLTPRQLEVLQTFAGGCTPQEAADALGVTLKTVDTHKTVILAECRVAWQMEENVRLDYHFLREKFGPFFE